MRVAGISWGPTGCPRDILRNAKADHLDGVHSDQKVLERIRRGRQGAGPCYRRPRVSKLTQRRLSGSSPLRSHGSRDRQVGDWSV
jgi:hypothetical protein